MTEGIIVGSDLFQEWLLPWWWENYSRHNDYPVAFFDFGLSSSKREWCLKRGKVIKLSSYFSKHRDEVDPILVHEWEAQYGENFWNFREAWFKKPLACMQSPFKKTVWLDLDCEVVGSIKPLFDALNNPCGIALAYDQIATSTFNSGVIAFKPTTKIIQEWGIECLEKSSKFRGDQDLLAHIITDKQIPVYELAPVFNWNVGFGLNPQAVIYHWLGESAKNALRNQLILSDL